MSLGAPKPPDPTKTAASQEGLDINTAIAQKALNNTNVSNPYGSTSYQQTGSTTVDGHQVPTYSQTTSLNPLLQSLLGSQEGAAGNAAKNINTGKLNFSGLPTVGDPNLLNQQTADAVYNQATSRLDPQFSRAQNQLSDQLAEQGIPIGSDAYNQQMQNFNLAKNDAYTSARNSATQAGVQDASQLYSDAIAGRQQGINEQVTGQNQPVSLLNSILAGITGTGSTAPTSSSSAPVTLQTPDIMSAYQNQYNQQNSQYGNTLGGIAGLGSTLLSAFL